MISFSNNVVETAKPKISPDIPGDLREVVHDGMQCKKCEGHNNTPLCQLLPCTPSQRSDGQYVYYVKK